MMKTIKIPGKTFMIGEYAAIDGADGLLLTTEPCFELTIEEGETHHNFPIGSPAYKLYKNNQQKLQDKIIHFRDPYEGMGGLGASSAQFLGLYDLLDGDHLYHDYLSHAYTRKGAKPSGYDLHAQQLGGVVHVNRKENLYKSHAWPFPQLHFALIHTGNKLATHTHLASMKMMDTQGLAEGAFFGAKSFIRKDQKNFIKAINQYHTLLSDLELVTMQTEHWIDSLRDEHFCQAAKGCGAMGSDIILVLYKPSCMEDLFDFVERKGLKLIAFGNQVAKGLTA